eukprot:scaffold36243_cov32-Prasinocladus_malaysianus.AAC.1
MVLGSLRPSPQMKRGPRLARGFRRGVLGPVGVRGRYHRDCVVSCHMQAFSFVINRTLLEPRLWTTVTSHVHK